MGTLFSHFENTLLRASVLRLLLLSTPWQCSSRSAFIMHNTILDVIYTTQHNEFTKWFVAHIFYPYLCSYDFAALLSHRPGSLTARWKLLCSQATGLSNDGQLCLWHVNYGANILKSGCVSFFEVSTFFCEKVFCAIGYLSPLTVSLTNRPPPKKKPILIFFFT